LQKGFCNRAKESIRHQLEGMSGPGKAGPLINAAALRRRAHLFFALKTAHGSNTSEKQTSRVDPFEKQKFTAIVPSALVAIWT
jgi:hypothetical protein